MRRQQCSCESTRSPAGGRVEWLPRPSHHRPPGLPPPRSGRAHVNRQVPPAGGVERLPWPSYRRPPGLQLLHSCRVHIRSRLQGRAERLSRLLRPLGLPSPPQQSGRARTAPAHTRCHGRVATVKVAPRARGTARGATAWSREERREGKREEKEREKR